MAIADFLMDNINKLNLPGDDFNTLKGPASE